MKDSKLKLRNLSVSDTGLFGEQEHVKMKTRLERLKTKVEESKCLSDTGLFGEREHIKIKTRLIDE
jgi:hypothetical protein